MCLPGSMVALPATQVREGAVATENLTVNVHAESHPAVGDVRFKVGGPDSVSASWCHPHKAQRGGGGAWSQSSVWSGFCAVRRRPLGGIDTQPGRWR